MEFWHWAWWVCRLGSILGELAKNFYIEEGRRVKSRIEKRTYSSLELSVRYNFKACFLPIFLQEIILLLISMLIH
jgi:hypothetical protein